MFGFMNKVYNNLKDILSNVFVSTSNAIKLNDKVISEEANKLMSNEEDRKNLVDKTYKMIDSTEIHKNLHINNNKIDIYIYK